MKKFKLIGIVVGVIIFVIHLLIDITIFCIAAYAAIKGGQALKKKMAQSRAIDVDGHKVQ